MQLRMKLYLADDHVRSSAPSDASLARADLVGMVRVVVVMSEVHDPTNEHWKQRLPVVENVEEVAS